MRYFLYLVVSSLLYVANATPLYDKCGVCHGEKGEKHSMDLTRPIAAMKANDIVKILEAYKNGKRSKYGYGIMMQGQTSKLSLEDMKKLGSYIEAFPPVKIKDTPKPKKEITVEELYEKCSACHGEKGEKKSLGVSKIIAGLKAEIITEELEEYKAGQKNLYGFGNMMRGQTTKLSHKQMEMLAKYIESFPPVELDQKKKPTRKISKEEIEFNKFMDEYFKNSKNPNETFEAAKKKYEEYKKNKGKK